VLLLLVGLSLALLTAYFGESRRGPLHSVQRGVLEAFSPIQEGANRALTPVRDLIGWFGDTFEAKGERDSLRAELDRLRQEGVAEGVAQAQNRELKAALDYSSQLELSGFQPVTARVIARPPTVWFSTITIDRGSTAGIRRDAPVVSGEALVGKVSEVSAHAAQVTLITDHTSSVTARVIPVGAGRIVRASRADSGATGIVQTRVGDPGELVLEFVSEGKSVFRGDRVATAGTSPGSRFESLFPVGIAIGEVTKVDDDGASRDVRLRPYADLRGLEFVLVLTRGPGSPS